MIFDWMWDPKGLNLKLSAAPCHVYALIYARSSHGDGFCCISQQAMADSLGFSLKSISRAIKTLLDDGLIECENHYRSAAEAKGFRGILGYRVVQSAIDNAILATGPAYGWEKAVAPWGVKVERPTPFYGYQPNDSTAGSAVESSCPEFSTPQRTPQETAGHNVETQCLNSDSACGKLGHHDPCGHFDSASKMPEWTNLPNVGTCGNVESEPRQTGPSTCGGDNKTAGFNFDQKYIQDEDEDEEEEEYISSLSSSSSTYNGNRSCRIEPAGWSELSEKDRQTFARFLAASSKSMLVTSKPEKLFDTQAAFVSCIHQGYTADEIFEAFDRYLNWFWGPQNTLGRETRFEMFPQNFLTARKGLYRWAHEDGALPAFETERASTAPGGEKSPGGAVGSPEPLNLRRLPDGGWMFQGKNRLWYPVGRDSQGKTRNEALEAAIELLRRDA